MDKKIRRKKRLITCTRLGISFLGLLGSMKEGFQAEEAEYKLKK